MAVIDPNLAVLVDIRVVPAIVRNVENLVCQAPGLDLTRAQELYTKFLGERASSTQPAVYLICRW